MPKSGRSLLGRLPRDPIDGGWRNVGQRAADPAAAKTETVEDLPRHRTQGTVGELVESTAEPKMAEPALKHGHDFAIGHRQHRQAAHHRARATIAVKFGVTQPRGIHAQDPGRGESFREVCRETPSVFDQGELAFRHAMCQQRIGKDAGTGTELDDRR